LRNPGEDSLSGRWQGLSGLLVDPSCHSEYGPQTLISGFRTRSNECSGRASRIGFKALSRGVLTREARFQGRSRRNSTLDREESSENRANVVQDYLLFMERLNRQHPTTSFRLSMAGQKSRKLSITPLSLVRTARTSGVFNMNSSDSMPYLGRNPVSRIFATAPPTPGRSRCPVGEA
jgi:hypothetical protein